MSELTRVAPESETPVNPYSLLEAVNRSSDTAHTGWLIFIAIMTYLMIAVAGVTHTTLLLETPVSLPILQVDIPLTQFFQFAPVVLVLFHLGLVSQLVLLARKTLEFDHAIRLLETSDRRLHPLRLELHNFFFVQAIAGPHRSRVMSAFLHGMSWLSIVVLPVVLILYIQVVFLPYHDEVITWTHRAALVVDVAMLVLIGVFLMRAESSFFHAFWRTTAAHPLSFLVTSLVIGLVTLFSFFVATVPGEPLDVASRGFMQRADATADRAEAQMHGFVLPFIATGSDGRLFGLFSRNLVVTDANLVADKDATEGEPTLSLRGRDLRYATLDRSDLFQADLTGADLSDASLDGTNLKSALLGCADINELLLSEDRDRALCTKAQGTDFSRAILTRAKLTGIDARGARFEDARLDGAELAYALIAGANLTGAKLERADLTGGVNAQGANFAIGNLQGADMRGARLTGADFRSATMQAVNLDFARMEGANLQGADLEAASLYRVRLQGADLSRVRLVAADLRGAEVWRAHPPLSQDVRLADLGGLIVRPVTEAEATTLKVAVGDLESDALRRQIFELLSPVLDPQQMSTWAGSSEQRAWDLMAQSSARTSYATPPVQPAAPLTTPAGAAPGDLSAVPAPVPVAAGSYGSSSYAAQLTEHIGAMICRPRWVSGGVASGIAIRAQAQHFIGDLAAIGERFAKATCPAVKAVSERILRDLATAADLGSTR